MDGKKANLVVTDPPYNVAYASKAGKIQNDNLKDSEFYQFLLKAFTKHDLPGLSDIAHRVKSGARIVKATQLVLCCENLEQACLTCEWHQLAQHVDEQYEAMAQVLEVIEIYRV